MSPDFAVPDPWDLDAARAVQESLRDRLDCQGGMARIRYLAGLDNSYSADDEAAYAAAVLFDLKRMEPIEMAGVRGRPSAPYVSGFLSFREIPLAMEALGRLGCRPDAILCDGQGIAHPRRMGLAAHLGVLLRIPSVGCAKSRLVGTYEEPGEDAGAMSPLYHKREQVGVVLRTRSRVKPVFVSPGNLIGIEAAARLVLKACRGCRIPEPVRIAHREVTRLRKGG